MNQAEKNPVVKEDLYQFKFLSEAAISPDGRYAAYVVSQAVEDENRYQSELWIMDLEQRDNRLYAVRGGASNPLWLADGSLLFVSRRDQDSEAQAATACYRLRLDGGEAVPYMTIPIKADQITPLTEHKFLVRAVASRSDRSPAVPETDEPPDYYIFEELPFWVNGKGIYSGKRAALYLYDRQTSRLEQITPAGMDITAFAVSADCRRAAFTGPEYESVRGVTTALYEYDLMTGRNRCLVADGQCRIDNLCYFGEEQLFYTGTTFERMGKNPRSYLYHLTARTVRALPFHDVPIGNMVGSDACYGGGQSLIYEAQQQRLYMLHTVWGNTGLVAMDQDGGLTDVCRLPGAITGFDIRGGRVIMTAMRGQHLAELYLLNVGVDQDGAAECLTGFNDEYLHTHKISEPVSFKYESRNGCVMEGYVIAPADYRPGCRYPAVLEIHGGPKSVFGGVFFHEMQCLAGQGLFVFYTNPRGSAGRGEAFADITRAFGRDDYADLMEFTDQVLMRYPDIDPERVGICGGSYGGFMCNWMVGHTDRYRAAVSQRSISNYLTKMLVTDIGYYVNRLQIGAYPWEDFDRVWAASPLASAATVRTPILFIQSDEDYRCWQGDAVQMFAVVKRAGTPARLVLFHGENHELSRSGKPHNRITRLKELQAWFRQYLQAANPVSSQAEGN